MSLYAYFKSKPRIAIIGTAGRDQHPGLTADLFEAMCTAALETIRTKFKLDPAKCQLISGGAAWSDHVAVELFLRKQVVGLTLYMPCAFTGGKFAEIGTTWDWKKNPGKTANYLHSLFTTKLGRDTLAEIALARDRRAVLNADHFGFHPRNDVVAAQATHMIAFTWSETGTPDDGGTAYTWDRAISQNKVHVCLGGLKE
jgi:AcrR family transcriptional regulator